MKKLIKSSILIIISLIIFINQCNLIYCHVFAFGDCPNLNGKENFDLDKVSLRGKISPPNALETPFLLPESFLENLWNSFIIPCTLPNYSQNLSQILPLHSQILPLYSQILPKQFEGTWYVVEKFGAVSKCVRENVTRGEGRNYLINAEMESLGVPL